MAARLLKGGTETALFIKNPQAAGKIDREVPVAVPDDAARPPAILDLDPFLKDFFDLRRESRHFAPFLQTDDAHFLGPEFAAGQGGIHRRIPPADDQNALADWGRFPLSCREDQGLVDSRQVFANTYRKPAPPVASSRRPTPRSEFFSPALSQVRPV
jgi:hypothetical protein